MANQRRKNLSILTTLHFCLLLFRVFGFYYLVRYYEEQFLSYHRPIIDFLLKYLFNIL